MGSAGKLNGQRALPIAGRRSQLVNLGGFFRQRIRRQHAQPAGAAGTTGRMGQQRIQFRPASFSTEQAEPFARLRTTSRNTCRRNAPAILRQSLGGGVSPFDQLVKRTGQHVLSTVRWAFRVLALIHVCTLFTGIADNIHFQKAVSFFRAC
jgi:hypothetical protein